MYYHKTWVRTGCQVCRKCTFSGNCSFLDTSMCTYTSMWQTGCQKTVAYFKVAHCLCTKCPTNCSHVLFPGLIYLFSLKEYEIWCIFQDNFCMCGLADWSLILFHCLLGLFPILHSLFNLMLKCIPLTWNYFCLLPRHSNMIFCLRGILVCKF